MKKIIFSIFTAIIFILLTVSCKTYEETCPAYSNIDKDIKTEQKG